MVYNILTATSIQELVKQVNEYLKQGYVCVGGLSVIPNPYPRNVPNDNIFYYQAVACKKNT